jgi:hypothetical protein
VRTRLVETGQVPVSDSCGHGNEFPCSIKGLAFTDSSDSLKKPFPLEVG